MTAVLGTNTRVDYAYNLLLLNVHWDDPEFGVTNLLPNLYGIIVA